MYYFLLLILTLQMFAKKLQFKNKIFFLKIWISIFIILSTIRWERGTDWKPYYENYTNNNSFIEFMEAIHFDKGYQFLNYGLKLIYSDYTFFLFFQSVVIGIIYYYMLKKYSDNIFISLWLYFVYYMGNLFFVRSTLALAIILLSINYIIKQKKKTFLLLVLLASSIHYSALIFLPAYFIFNKIEFSKKQILFLLFLTILGILFLDEGIKIIFQNLYPHRMVYFEKNYISTLGMKQKYLVKAILTRIFFIISYIFLIDKTERNAKITKGFFKLYLIGALLNILISNINPMLSRVVEYYEISQLFLISKINFMTKNNLKRIIGLLIIIYFIYNFMISLNSYKELYIPYKTIFNKELQVITY